MILIATIEHSGTFTLLDLLGYWQRGGKPIAEADADTEIAFTHLYDSDMDAIFAAAKTRLVVTTDRPTDDIRCSWERRGRDVAELEQQLANYERLKELKPYVVALGARHSGEVR